MGDRPQGAGGATGPGKLSHLLRGTAGRGSAARPPPRHSAAPREWPASRPAGGCALGGGERPGHQNRRRLWAGAALAGSLRRAASKDGQRVRRRLRPRSPLAPRASTVPEPPPPEVGAGRTESGASAGERGRAAPGARGGRAETMAARAPGQRSAGPPAAPSRTCEASRPERPGHPARRAAGGALGVPTPGPGRGGARAGSGPGRGGAGRGNPCGTAGTGAPLPLTAFLPPERRRVSLFQDLPSHCIPIVPRLASRSDLKAETVEWGSNRGRPARLNGG